MEGLSSPFKFLSNVQDFKLPTSCYVSPGAPMPFTTIAPLIRSSSLALDIRLRPLWPHSMVLSACLWQPRASDSAKRMG